MTPRPTKRPSKRLYAAERGCCRRIRATGGVSQPSNNDTGNVAGILAENVQISEVDLSIGTRTLGAWTYTSGLVQVSIQLLQDSAFDLDAWLPKKLGQRLGRGLAADLVNGSGTGRPTGLATVVRTGVTGATGQTTSVTYGNLVDLIHSVDPAYRQGGGCSFLMNDLSMGAIRKIVDNNGRPLWAPTFPGGFMSSQNGGQGEGGVITDTILGYPVIVDNAVPVMAANAKSIVFGDLRAGYVVRQVLDPTIMTLRERYADYLQVGYCGFLRADGNIDDAAATAAYVNSAT